MRYLSLFLVLGLVLMGCMEAKEEAAAPAPVQNAAPAGPPPWQDDYEEMVSVLALSPTEQDEVKKTFEQGYAAFEARLVGEEGQDLMAEEAKLREAVENKDLSSVRSITRRAAPKRQAMVAGVKQIKIDVLNTLSPEKQHYWNSHLISKELLTLAAPLALSGEQEYALREQAQQALYAAQQRNEVNPMAAAFLQLEAWAEEMVFSAQQYTAYQDVKQANPMRSLKW